jgi:hypothetical protein
MFLVSNTFNFYEHFDLDLILKVTAATCVFEIAILKRGTFFPFWVQRPNIIQVDTSTIAVYAITDLGQFDLCRGHRRFIYISLKIH